MEFRAHRVNIAVINYCPPDIVPFYLPRGITIPEGEYDVSIVKARRKRTLSENALLHAICQAIGNHTGHSITEIKEIVKMEAISANYPHSTLRKRIIPKPSHLATTAECAILIDTAYRLAAELGVDTSAPLAVS